MSRLISEKKFLIDVPEGKRKERIDTFLTHHIENTTRSKVQKAVDAGLVKVNGVVVKSNYNVKPFDKVEATQLISPRPEDVEAEDIALDIVFILWDLKNLYSDPCNRGENLAALGLDVLGAIVPFATGLGAGYKASKGVKPIVIGENMRDRVIPYAKEIGADWYKPRSNNPERWLGNNERWLQTKMAEGREIIDIGIDPLRTTRSPYYEVEKNLIQSNNYHITYP